MALSHNSTLTKSEPDWGSVDKTTLPRNAFADQGEPDKKSTWSYPHHFVENGKVGAAGVYDSGDMYLHRGGLNAAWAAAQGAHTGQKASAEVIAHLEAHRKAIGMGTGMGDQKMASMTSTLTAIGDKGSADVSVLFDTGAAQSFIRRSVAEKIATIVKLPKPTNFRLADGSSMMITETAVVAIDAGGQSLTDTFLIMEDSVNDVILGESTMRRFALKIDMERGQVYAEIKQEEKVMWKKFLAAIGISVADEVTEEKATELVKAKLATVKAPIASPKILAVLDLKETATEDEVRGAILALKSPGNVVAAADHEKLQGELHEHKIIAAVASARAIGKLTPAEEPVWLKDLKDGKESLATFATFIERRGKVVPIDVKLAAKKDEPAAAAQIDDVQAQVNKMMGVTPERFAKYNQRTA